MLDRIAGTKILKGLPRLMEWSSVLYTCESVRTAVPVNYQTLLLEFTKSKGTFVADKI
jgi:hypothetical protein